MKFFKYAVFFVFLVLALISAYLYFNRLNLPYNDQGRFFDAERAIVYHEQSVFAYGFTTLVLLIPTILIGRWIYKSRKLKKVS